MKCPRCRLLSEECVPVEEPAFGVPIMERLGRSMFLEENGEYGRVMDWREDVAGENGL